MMTTIAVVQIIVKEYEQKLTKAHQNNEAYRIHVRILH
jgi:hypothetical protein